MFRNPDSYNSHYHSKQSSTGKLGLLLLAGGAVALGVVSAMQNAAADEQSSGLRQWGLELPSIESLTYDSDFSVFMAPSVPAEIRRRALRRLWSFPVFNQTDGLANYAGDYTAGGKEMEAGNSQFHQATAANHWSASAMR